MEFGTNPDKIDWRLKGIIGPVKNLGFSGNLISLAVADICGSQNGI